MIEVQTPIRLTYCIYCASTFALTRDHVIPSSFTHSKRTFRNIFHVTACRECNSTLGDHMFITVSERAAYLTARYRVKYADTLKFPVWTSEELAEMSSNFQKKIEANNSEVKFQTERIKRLQYVSHFGEDILDVDAIANEHIAEQEFKKRTALKDIKKIEETSQAVPEKMPKDTPRSKYQMEKAILRNNMMLEKLNAKKPTTIVIYDIRIRTEENENLRRSIDSM